MSKHSQLQMSNTYLLLFDGSPISSAFLLLSDAIENQWYEYLEQCIHLHALAFAFEDFFSRVRARRGCITPDSSVVSSCHRDAPGQDSHAPRWHTTEGRRRLQVGVMTRLRAGVVTRSFGKSWRQCQGRLYTQHQRYPLIRVLTRWLWLLSALSITAVFNNPCGDAKSFLFESHDQFWSSALRVRMR